MREIKFRALKKRGGGFVYGYFWKSPDGTSYIKQDGEDFEVLENTLCQFVGSKDKNSKDIFDCDILEFYVLELGKKVKRIAFISFCDEDLCYWLYYNLERTTFCGLPVIYNGNTLNCEVIGNINENSDLLI